ncbi:mariner transposase [Trichonephila clavipes]|nr:mariner transposase [Trichonephila clavipes]
MDRISICEALAKRNEIDPFLTRMVTGDEKWVVYDNIVRKRSWSKRGEAAQTVAKPGPTIDRSLKRRNHLTKIRCLPTPGIADIEVARFVLDSSKTSSFEHHAGDSTIWLGSIPISKESTLGGYQGPPTTYTNLTRGLASRLRERLFSFPILYRYYAFMNTHGLLWDSNPRAMTQQSASLTTILDGRH